MLGRADEPPRVEDDMLKRTELKTTRTVVEIERPSFDQIEVATGQTDDALRSEVSGPWHGRSAQS
jgi:hypothetical protein